MRKIISKILSAIMSLRQQEMTYKSISNVYRIRKETRLDDSERFYIERRYRGTFLGLYEWEVLFGDHNYPIYRFNSAYALINESILRDTEVYKKNAVIKNEIVPMDAFWIKRMVNNFIY